MANKIGSSKILQIMRSFHLFLMSIVLPEIIFIVISNIQQLLMGQNKHKILDCKHGIPKQILNNMRKKTSNLFA